MNATYLNAGRRSWGISFFPSLLLIGKMWPAFVGFTLLMWALEANITNLVLTGGHPKF
jgi:hypothetical protein